MARSAADVMWAEALALLAQADHQRREFFKLAQVGWEPPIDVLETEVELVVVVALPGVRANEVEVVIGASELATRARDGGRRRCVRPACTGWNCRTVASSGVSDCRLAPSRSSGHDLVDGCLDHSSTKARLMAPTENAGKPVLPPTDDTLILTPVRDTVLLPGAMTPLAATLETTAAGLQEAARTEQHVVVVLHRDSAVDAPGREICRRSAPKHACCAT